MCSGASAWTPLTGAARAPFRVKAGSFCPAICGRRFGVGFEPLLTALADSPPLL